MLARTVQRVKEAEEESAGHLGKLHAALHLAFDLFVAKLKAHPAAEGKPAVAAESGAAAMEDGADGAGNVLPHLMTLIPEYVMEQIRALLLSWEMALMAQVLLFPHLV